MANLYLLKYNNYYNRIVKKENKLSEYLPYSLGEIIFNVNFIPGDNVLTTQIVNWSKADPDYVLVTDGTDTIVSRWFVIETVRTRKGQLKLTLHRDLMVDFYNSIINAPCFIEKATLQELGDPAIFNKEDMSFNQIKRAQYPLKDGSNTAWIVGYVPRDAIPQEGEADQVAKVTYNYAGITPDEIVDDLTDYDHYYISQYGDGEYISDARDLEYGINVYTNAFPEFGSGVGPIYFDFSIYMNIFGHYIGHSKGTSLGSIVTGYTGNRAVDYVSSEAYYSSGDYLRIDTNAAVNGFFPENMVNIATATLPLFKKGHTQSDMLDLLSAEGHILYNKSDGQLYRVHVYVVTNKEDGTVKKSTETVNIGAGSKPFNLLRIGMNNCYAPQNGNNPTYRNRNGDPPAVPDGGTFTATVSYVYYKVELEALSTTASVTIRSPENRYHLVDAPYDMFCIPYPAEGQQLSIYDGPNKYIDVVDRDAGMNIATSLTTIFGKENILDLQLLPYCPIKNLIRGDPGFTKINIQGYFSDPINIQNLDSSGQPMKDPQGKVIPPKKASILFWCTYSKFELDIPFRINAATTVLDKKIASETEMWRLCSPNYNGVFEFDLQKNGGISTINADCTYKPFNPYIHMNPNFGGLYGYDWNDSRGLICGGDFSLPLMTSAWADYQLQNKNYQQMFDRQIQNLEVNNAVQREKEKWQVAAGTMSAFAQGKTAGDNSFLGLGGLMGVGNMQGAAQAAFSTAAGLRDIQLNNLLRNETLDYTKDQFGYQLGNIKAIPQSLAKVDAFTNNNRIFPFIEQYTCTPEEREALRNKLEYNGMTVMRISTISAFISGEKKNYTKGKLIRFEDLPEDYHIATAIADEINKGVFI